MAGTNNTFIVKTTCHINDAVNVNYIKFSAKGRMGSAKTTDKAAKLPRNEAAAAALKFTTRYVRDYGYTIGTDLFVDVIAA
jgi:hypothetical protein